MPLLEWQINTREYIFIFKKSSHLCHTIRLLKTILLKATRFFVILVSVISLSLVQCAKKGTPSGGAIDTLPPVITRTAPENYTTNFNDEEIRIYFDEYIKLKDIQKQLIISPPLKNQPTITPYGVSKEVRISFNDTLKENTTYTINFGQSIVDNNEDNPYDFYKYVFSTGSYIDSLSISGTIADAIKMTPEEAVTVMLYEVDENYTDSVVYNQKPLYVANTLKNPEAFTIENIKEGTYLLVALKDKSNDYLFFPNTDKIAFEERFITIPSDTTYRLTLFKEVPEYKLARPKQLSNNRIQFGYEGEASDMKVELLSQKSDSFAYKLVNDQKTDTVYYWYKPTFVQDSLQFIVRNKQQKDTITLRLSDIPTDSLQVKAQTSSTIKPDEPFIIGANLPMQHIYREHIEIIDKDSIAIPFQTELDSLYNQLKLTFEKEERQQYNITLFPGAIVDFFETPNDTLQFKTTTKAEADYGFLALNLQNVKAFPIIVQLVAEDGITVKTEQYSTKETTFEFEHIDPGKYYIRLIYDRNENGEWDTGNFLKRQQPEKVIYYPTLLDIRANWNLNETFILD